MISCLMVTRPTARRIALAKHSIADYCRQTHTDRELVIVVDGTAAPDDVAALSDFVTAQGRPDIRVHLPAVTGRLGALRNLGVALAAGDVICQWDDDDRYHPQRLEAQYARLNAADHEAVYLQEVMQYFPDREALYLTNWRSTPAGGHPGTLMARRTAAIRYPEVGAEAELGEDLAVALALKARGRVGYLGGEAHLHVYVSHGENSWDPGHHAMLARELGVSIALLRRNEASIRSGLAPFAFRADSINVTGHNGIAFRI
ncbi:glycosyltransferase family 2 protein [Novosphingobium lentum]|uniref:glycosyltransferase family 2 protein n=1 Tax=Novosphingobium lentum TaxID=145287 RepID=UPI0008331315|nr:glycosyltransferase family A protein [Novosphingobium lentum]